MHFVAIAEFSRSAWRAGLRGRAIQSILILGLVLMGVAYLAASFSPRQPQAVALDVGFSMLRLVSVLLGLFWVQELISKEIERRTVVLTLAYPAPRSAYLIGRYMGMLALLALACLALSLLLWTLVFSVGGEGLLLGYPFWFTVFGIWLDCAVVVAFALLIACLSTVQVLPLALGLAFAVGGRALGAARAYITSGAEGDVDLVAQMNPLLTVIHWIIPDLSRLDWRVWPLYGISPGSEILVWASVAALGYLVAMMVLAIRVFARREFG